eukprot:Nk52_evm9s628 gene=Nk52_evmTU9s628
MTLGTKADAKKNVNVITAFHNGGHDSEDVPSQWIFPKKMYRAIGPFGLPLSGFLILGVEFLERWAYSGVNIMSFQYCQDMLRIDSASVTSIFNGLQFWSLANSVIFAFLADAYWGKWKTIAISVVIYACALTLISVTSTPLGYGDFPNDPQVGYWAFFLGLVLLGIGAGGVKTNVAPMCAEQLFRPNAKDIEKVLTLMYWTNNVGITIGVAISPYLINFGPKLEENEGTSFYVPFSLSCALFYVGLCLFAGGKNVYTHRIPSGSVFSDFYHIVKSAIKNRHLSYDEVTIEWNGVQEKKAPENAKQDQCISNYDKKESAENVKNHKNFSSVSLVPLSRGMLDIPPADYFTESSGYILSGKEKCSLEHSREIAVEENGNAVADFDFDSDRHWVYKAEGFSYSKVKGVRQVFRMLPFFVFFSIYYMCYNSFVMFLQISKWLDRPSWIEVPTLSMLVPLCVSILIPVHAAFVYPLLRSKFGLELKVKTRMIVGFVFMSSFFALGTILQYLVVQQGYVTDDGNFVGTGEYEGNTHATIPIWWIAPCYVLQATSEVWSGVALFEWSYTQAPKNMASMMMAMFTLSNAMGALLNIIFHFAFVPSRYIYTLPALGGVILLIVPGFYFTFRSYEEKGVYMSRPVGQPEETMQMYHSALSPSPSTQLDPDIHPTPG